MTSTAFRASWLAAACALACGTESPGESPGAGGSGGGGAGVTPAPTTGGDSASGGGAGAASAGQAGAFATGGAAGGGGGQAGASTAGVATGGSGGASGGAGSSGASGSGAAGGAGSTLPKRVLLYHFSTLAIASVTEQLALLGDRLREWGYEVETSADPTDVSAQKLATLGAVGMINTCFEPFGKGQAGTSQAAALAAFVEGGGGLFGTHCASVTFQSAQPPHPYNQLLGGRGGDGYFDGVSSCSVLETHPSTALLPQTFDYSGNLDNADFLAPGTTVLVRCRWSGGAQQEVPVSWYRQAGKGRVFYTNFAKESADLKGSTPVSQHAFAGLGWVLGR